MRKAWFLIAVLSLGVGSSSALQAGIRDKFGGGNKAAAEAYDPPADRWEPYFRDDKGRTYPLVQPIEENKDKDWMFLAFTEYAGPRIRLAVMPVENSTGLGQVVAGAAGTVVVSSDVPQVPIGGIEDLLTTALLETGRFDLVERKAVGNVLAEQDLAAEGRVTAQSAARTGNVLGAQYLIEAAVNDWTPDKSKVGGAGGGASRRRFGGLGGGKRSAEVAMSFRVIDAETSQVLFATTQRAINKSWSIGLGFLGAFGGPLRLLGGVGGFEKNAPISYAVVSCINKGVYELAMWLGDKRWSGRVVQVQGGSVYVNAGSNAGLVPGMVLTAKSVGEPLIDPATGLELGRHTVEVGALRIVDVEENFSIATVQVGCDGLERGDIVEIAE